MRNSFGYFLKTAFQSLKKNFMMTVAAVSVLIACMLIIGTAYLFSANVSNFMDRLEQQNEIIAFIDDAVGESDFAALKETVSAMDHVLSVDFVTKDEALQEYRQDLGEDGAYLDSFFGEENPLRHSLRISIDDISYFEEMATKVAAVEGIANVRDSQEVVNFLLQLRKVIEALGFWIMIILSVVAFFIIANTIKIAMYNRRTEINIMRYVGATNGFIRFPFVLEGVIIGTLAVAICFAVEWYIYSYVLRGLLASLNFVSIIPFRDIYWHILILFGAIGIVVSVFGSLTSIRRYLKA